MAGRAGFSRQVMGVSMAKLATLILGAGAALFAASSATAQYRDGQPAVGQSGGLYRDGQPQVLAPPPPPPDASIGASQRFRAANARAKRPRIVIFWNREFTDDVASKHEDYVKSRSSSTSVVASGSESVAGWGYSASRGAAMGVTTSQGEVRAGVDNVTDNRRDSQYSEAEDFDLEAAFTGMLQGAGANLIDRTSIMRTTGLAKGAGERSNVQGLETSAILGKADIVLEVVQLADYRKSTGVTYRVVARNVRTGRVLATLSTAAKPPVGRQPWVAGPDGRMTRATPPEPGPQEIGRQLAVETMNALAARM